jgi:phospholipid-translocating ATPase
VIHRGLIISVIQAVFSSIFFFARQWKAIDARQHADNTLSAIAVYQGWLQVGYATQKIELKTA